jgi:hypothetical protein
MPGIMEYTDEMGCESSYADAKHDFHDIFKGAEGQTIIKNLVKQNIPHKTCMDNLTEDKFLMKYILKTAESTSTPQRDSTSPRASIPSKPIIIEKMQSLFSKEPTTEEIFNDNINSRYLIIPIHRKQHDKDTIESLIQNKLNDNGVLDDIYLVCDVAYANVREDLTYVKKTNQYFYWVQNSQTLYDPAGKTAWHTGKEYGFQSPESRFLFCWENANKKAITYYPEWNGTTLRYDDVFYPEKMLYTNKNLYLTIKSDSKNTNYNNYKDHDAILIITDKTKPGYFAYADKDLSAKGDGIFNKSQITAYRNKGNELKRFVKLLNKPTSEIPSIFLDETIDYSSSIQILAKKVGDSSQSLSCCKNRFYLQKFINNEQGLNSKGEIIGVIKDFESNGNHMFVSYDRIAIGCALNYNSPLVLQNSEDGFILYIRKDLTNPLNQKEKVLKPLLLISNDIEDFITNYVSKLNTIITNINTNIESFTEIIVNDEDKISKKKLKERALKELDKQYQILLIKFFRKIPFFELINTIPKHILSFESGDLKIQYNKLIKDYLDKKIEELKEYDISIENFGEGTDFLSNISIISDKFNDELIKLNTDFGESGERVTIEQIKIIKAGTIIQDIEIFINNFYKEIDLTKEIIEKIEKLSEKIQDFSNESDYIISTNIPSGISLNIKGCTPFYNLDTSYFKEPKDNAFESRSSSIFGIHDIIYTIFNSFTSPFFTESRNKFVSLINNIILTILEKSSGQPYNVLVKIAQNELLSKQFIEIPLPVSILSSVTSSAVTPIHVESVPQESVPEESVPEELSSESPTVTPTLVSNTSFPRSILQNMGLLITNPKSNSSLIKIFIKNLKDDKIEEIIDKLLSNTESYKQFTANDIDVFLKGFLGICMFLQYYIKKGKKVPAIIVKKRDTINVANTNLNQQEIFQKFIEITNRLFFEDGLPVPNSEEGDTDIDIKINPFRKLIESNNIGFDDKKLTDDFIGYNANEFNFNMVLLYYFENKLNTRNFADVAVGDEYLPGTKSNSKKLPNKHDGLDNLFKQLFKTVKLNYIISGGAGSSSESSIIETNDNIELPDTINTIIEYFFTDDKVNINNVKTMKTNFEILLNTPSDLLRDLRMLKEEIKTGKTNIIQKINDNQIYPNLKKYFNIIYPNLLTFEEKLAYERLTNTINYELPIIDKENTTNMRTGNHFNNKINNEIPINKPLYVIGGKRTLRKRKQKTTNRKYRKTNKRITKRRFRKTKKY